MILVCGSMEQAAFVHLVDNVCIVHSTAEMDALKRPAVAKSLDLLQNFCIILAGPQHLGKQRCHQPIRFSATIAKRTMADPQGVTSTLLNSTSSNSWCVCSPDALFDV